MKRRERTVSPEERATIRAAIEGPLLDYLDALTWTGARPGEIMRLEASHIDFSEGVASLRGKTTDATGELITFPLVPPMLALCRLLAEQNPKGPLFRNAEGNPWTPNAVRCRMRRLRDKLKIKGVTAYTFRHSFATDALERGVPVTDVAALMNHRDIRTTMGYSHLKERREHLKRQAEKATGEVRPEEA
jgi:integrase